MSIVNYYLGTHNNLVAEKSMNVLALMGSLFLLVAFALMMHVAIGIVCKWIEYFVQMGGDITRLDKLDRLEHQYFFHFNVLYDTNIEMCYA
jgi:hypothetical protein